jgi:hypothetical protein
LTWAPSPVLAVGLAAGAALLATASRGDALVLGLLLVALGLAPTTGAAVAGALVASSWRWGTTSLEALAGAQAVLGPAGGVGSSASAAGSWLAAGAIVLALGRRPDPVRAVPAGIAAAALLAGPAPGGDVPIRVFVALGAAAAAFGIGHLRATRPQVDRALAVLAAAAGLAAVVAVAPDAPSWPPSLALADLREGGLFAGAAIALVLVADAARRRAPWSLPGATPIVDRPSQGPSHRRRR